ncbi:hypothetical protein [Rubrivivax sp. JA1026]|uniref:hypothetical protein n=1 Tax=Rubrivivax sp. JA1026 TaxID=2710888 RepID=UPI0013E97B84|nr:hypothetical protein [Rubrivivax sp. JA1026]
MSRAEPDLTRDDLHAALQRMRQRLTWLPQDLDTALQRPMVRAGLLGYARELQRQHRAAKPVPPAATRLRLPRLPAGAFDARRAAAGDRDD